jgi:hypothetical protein
VEWCWQWVFPQHHRWTNADSGEQGRHHMDHSLIQSGEASGARHRNSDTCHLSYLPALVRHPPAGAGQDIRTIQELMGYNDVDTTMIYTHVLNRSPLGVASHADLL